jgi:hypothetical protein
MNYFFLFFFNGKDNFGIRFKSAKNLVIDEHILVVDRIQKAGQNTFMLKLWSIHESWNDREK